MTRDDYDIRVPDAASSDRDTSPEAADAVEPDLSSEGELASSDSEPDRAMAERDADMPEPDRAMAEPDAATAQSEVADAQPDLADVDEPTDARTDLSGEGVGPETLDAPGPASTDDAAAPALSGDDATRIQPVPAEAPGEPASETAVATVEGGAEEAPEGLWPDGMTEELRRRWDAIQMRFVDDPSAVAADAKALVGEAVSSLRETLSRWEREVEEWATESDDTEELRRMVARYRRRLESLIS